MITGSSVEGVRIWVATRPVDMRKGFDGLAEVVRAFLGGDPLSGDLFVFGGESRLAHHGVTKVMSGTAPAGCGLKRGRINITLRETGLSD